MIYLLFISILSFSAFVGLTKASKNNKIVVLIFNVIITILIIGLRYEVGTDYWNYYSLFKRISIDNLSTFTEPGFQLVVIIIKQIYDSYFFFTFGYTLLCMLLLSFVIYHVNYSKGLWLNIFVLIIIAEFNSYSGSIRVGFAFVFLIYSVQFIINGDVNKFVLSVLLAASLHFSAIVFLLAYFVRYFKISNKGMLAIFVIIIVIGQYNGILSYVKNFSDFLLNSTSLKELPYISRYVIKLEGYLLPDRLAGSLGITSIVKKVTLFLYFTYLRKRTQMLIPEYEYLYRIVFLGYALYFLITPSMHLIGSRIVIFFTIFEYFLLVLPMVAIKKRINKIIMFIFSISVAVSTFIITVISWYDYFIPYNTFLF